LHPRERAQDTPKIDARCSFHPFTCSLTHSLTHSGHTADTSTRLFSLGCCARICTSTHVLLTTLSGVALQPAQREHVRSRVAVAPVDHFATTRYVRIAVLNRRQTFCMYVCVLETSWRRIRAACVERMIIALRFVAHALPAHTAYYCLTTGTHERQTSADETRLSSTWAAQSQRSCTREGVAGQRHLWHASTTIAGAARLHMLCISHGCAVSSHLALRNTLTATLTQRHP
jgi:hypothetical protein